MRGRWQYQYLILYQYATSRELPDRYTTRIFCMCSLSVASGLSSDHLKWAKGKRWVQPQWDREAVQIRQSVKATAYNIWSVGESCVTQKLCKSIGPKGERAVTSLDLIHSCLPRFGWETHKELSNKMQRYTRMVHYSKGKTP